MKKYSRLLLLILSLIGVLLVIAGCAGAKTPYQINDEQNYNVSVRFDANGGTFTTNVTVMTDSFNLEQMPREGNEAQIPLLSPDDSRRGSGNSFTAVNNGYFLVGWYANKEAAGDGESFRYSGKWDFSADRLSVDLSGDYSAQEPVLTLYAVWAPLFEIEFYDINTQELLDTYAYDPNLTSVDVPRWNVDKGTIDMKRFPVKSGFTFDGAFYDAEGTKPVDTDTVLHPGVVDETTGAVTDSSMKLYVNWKEGEWYHIYTAEQFVDNASVSGNYVIFDDLDFTDEIWPSSLMYGKFSGSILGNGHSFSNISAMQSNSSKIQAGLFGNITETAVLQDVTFDNVKLTLQKGTNKIGMNYGLFAGFIANEAKFANVQLTNSVLQIDSGIYFTEDSDYIIGLICGMGNDSAVTYSNVTCVATGDTPDSVHITVVGNQVDFEIVKE